MTDLQKDFLKVTDKLTYDMPIIIQSFINFYGIDKQEYIINRFHNSRIIWFKGNYIKGNNIEEYIISTISKEELDNILQKLKKMTFLQSCYISELDLLVLPLSYNLNHILHEMNHMLGSPVLSTSPLVQISGLSYSIERNGMISGMNYDLNEVINERITREVLTNLNQLGVKVNPTPTWQTTLFPLVDLFFEYFQNILKNTFISGNLPALVKQLGEENYKRLSQLVLLQAYRLKMAIKKGIKPDISITDIEKANQITKQMKESYDNFRGGSTRSKR